MKQLLRLTIIMLLVAFVLPALSNAADSHKGKKATMSPPIDPQILVTPDSFAVPLYQGDSTFPVLKIYNNGVSNTLNFSFVLATPVLPAKAKPVKHHEFTATPAKGSNLTQNFRRITTARPALTVSPKIPRPSSVIGSVLVLTDGSTEGDISTVLTAAGYAVTDTTLASTYDGTNPSPSGFNAVILLDNSGGVTDMAASGQDSLVAYVNAGGGLLTTGWFPIQVGNGNYTTLSTFLLRSLSYGIVDSEKMVVAQPHPITSGMPDTTIFETGFVVGTAAQGTVMMTGPLSGDAVVAASFGAGKVVEYSWVGDYAGWFPYQTAGVQTLLVNTINWFNVPGWLSADAYSGSILPGDSLSINLGVRTTGLPLGDFWKDIKITSDDPINPLVAVRVHLTVNAVVPIQLASFYGTEAATGVALAWATFSEVNNYGFYVERRDGRTGQYKTVSALIPGAGTSLERHDYAWSDTKVSGGEYFYRLRQVDLNGVQQYSPEIVVRVTGVLGVKTEAAPKVFALKQNYPNPFNPTTSVKFSVAQSEHATLKVYNMLGQAVMNLFDGQAEAGRYYQAGFDAAALPSGIYFYRLVTDSRSDVKKMMLLK